MYNNIFNLTIYNIWNIIEQSYNNLIQEYIQYFNYHLKCNRTIYNIWNIMEQRTEKEKSQIKSAPSFHLFLLLPPPAAAVAGSSSSFLLCQQATLLFFYIKTKMNNN